MKVIMVIAVVIVFVVLLLAVLTTSKAYTYKHTIDPIDDIPNAEKRDEPKKIGTDD